MKRLFVFLFLSLSAALYAQDKTLRLDYIFYGDADHAGIALSELRSLDGWAGRRSHMDELPLKGNGQVTVRDESGNVLYRTSFSSLFQEWQTTEEATRTSRSFENVFLVPMPEAKATVTVELFDPHARVTASFTHPVDPSDILIRPANCTAASRDLMINGSINECIDVLIVAEGYTPGEMETFYKDARAAMEAILSHEPFKAMKDRFNFRAAGLVSSESGVSIPGRGIWKDTPLHSHFNTFYTDRYLTTLHVKDLHDAIAGIPYEHIIILANTDYYGGGGIYNSYTLTTAHHGQFKPVVVHEFGHSFGGLADEYFYDDQFGDYYPSDTEPWEQNLTTKVDFSSKWEDMVGTDGVGVHEGGGYKSKGVWRGCEDCRMKTNTAAGFCPVCQRALERLIRFYTD
ncbi:MAG: peptidase M64 [Bacteroidales bacterium]|nr:peptidase M64 [Bacteroidales bacterium]